MSGETRVLFVSNGHGEAAIADRLARELDSLAPGLASDHLALVGEGHSAWMREVGPQRHLPSGGIVAMGNVRNIARDLAGGLLGLTLAQRRFLVSSRTHYAATIAVGDVYALLMALAAHAPTAYVGTAKSVLVAPYGPLEERVLRRAKAIFVRDAATAERLRSHGVDAEAPGNVIVDLFADDTDPSVDRAFATFAPRLALFPGSRTTAYEDAVFALDVLATCAPDYPELGAAMSVAPTLSVDTFIEHFRARGWSILRHEDRAIPFSVCLGDRVLARAWCGSIGALLPHVQLVVGQAGTANEAASSAGVPIVAFERGHDRKTAWYRMRQQGLLGDALAILPGDAPSAGRALGAILGDPATRATMGEIGRARMGSTGGARAIARRISSIVHDR